VLWALPLVAGLIWWWYRQVRSARRQVAGLWLWQKTAVVSKANRRIDWRLVLLISAATLVLFALAAPSANLGTSSERVVILSAAASMRATDISPSRLDQGIARAKEQLKVSKAVLVIAGRTIQTFGPAPGPSLLMYLEGIETGSQPDLELAVQQARRVLPAPAVLIADAPLPPGLAGKVGYINVAGNGQNIGITSIGQGFISLGNSGPGRWEGQVQVGGKEYPLAVRPGGFASLELPETSLRARLKNKDALYQDGEASFSRRQVRVRVSGSSPVLERLLVLLGARRAEPAEVAFVLGTPRGDPKIFTVFFATKQNGQAIAETLEYSPYTGGVELTGFPLALPPPPLGQWRPLVVGEDKTLAWDHPQGLYLPSLESLQNLPALPVLLFNVVAPLGEVRTGLLSPAETLLPRPTPDQPLPGSRVSLTPWLALLAVALLLLDLFFTKRLRQNPSFRGVQWHFGSKRREEA
jgi:Ca-activated chloride channel homolog